jgi:hypothetical protein
MHVTKKRDLAVAIAVIGFANFIIFLLATQYLGGSAGNGLCGRDITTLASTADIPKFRLSSFATAGFMATLCS